MIEERDKDDSECTFKPILNEKTRDIMKRQGRATDGSESPSPRIFGSLYHEAEVREHKQRISEDLGVKAQCSFQPQIRDVS